MDLYKDFKVLAKQHHLSVGQAVYRLAMIRTYRERSLLRVNPVGKYPRSLNFVAFVEAFPCCVCGTKLRKYKNTKNIVAVRVHEGAVGSDVGSDYTSVPVCRKCLKDPVAVAIVRAHHCAIQNKMFEAYIRASEGT